MSEVVGFVGVAVIVYVVYWGMYFVARRKLGARWWVNLVMVVAITWGYQMWVLVKFGLWGWGTGILAVVSGVGALMHHLAVVRKWSEVIHGPVSHTLFFVSFGVNSLVVGKDLLTRAGSGMEMGLVWGYLTVSGVMMVWGVMVGVRWKTLI